MKTKTVMTNAWVIARSAVTKFGGSARQYLAEALKQAWAITRKPVLAGLNVARQEQRIEDAIVRTEAHGGWSKGWMAQITLATSGAKFDLDRRFISGDKSGLSRAGNGVIEYTTKFLSDGIYETDSVYRSYTAHRSYFRIIAGAVVEVFASKDAAKTALA